MIRLAGASGDLHDEDAQYHHDCYKGFNNSQNMVTISKQKQEDGKPDTDFIQ